MLTLGFVFACLCTVLALVVGWYLVIAYQSRRKEGSEEEVVRGMDGLYLSLDRPTNHMIINGVFFFTGKVSADAVIRHMRERVIGRDEYRRLTQVTSEVPDQMDSSISYYLSWRTWTRLPFFLPTWRSYAKFSLADHITERPLEAYFEMTGQREWDEGVGEDEMLQKVLSHLSSLPMDKKRPMWEDFLIHLPSGPTVLLSRIHHSISDGIGLVNYTMDITDAVEAEEKAGEKEGEREREKGGWKGGESEGGKESPKVEDQVTSVSRMDEDREARASKEVKERGKKSLWERLTSAVWMVGHFLKVYVLFHVKTADPETFLTPSSLPLSGEKLVAWMQPPLKLDEVKQVARHHSGTINDVLLTVTSIGLQKYARHLQGKEGEGETERREGAKEDTEVSPLPPLKAFVPVGNAFAANRPLDLQNQFGFVFLHLPTDVTDPSEAVREVKRQMDALKASPADMIFSYLYTKYSGDVSPPIAMRIGTEYYSGCCSLVFTNVKGPPGRVSFAGVPVKEMCFFVPQAGSLGLGISIFSYAGAISMAVNCDATRVADPSKLLECCREAFDEMRNVGEEE